MRRNLIFATLLLAGCGQQELDKLRAENQALKTKVSSLEQENEQLKETDQNYFARSIDKIKTARTDEDQPDLTAQSKADLQDAGDIFEALIAKFPASPYVVKAKGYVLQIRKKVHELERIETGKETFYTALAAHDFYKATVALRGIKTLIPNDEYKALNRRISEEKNKPIEITYLDFYTARIQEKIQYGERYRFRACVVGGGCEGLAQANKGCGDRGMLIVDVRADFDSNENFKECLSQGEHEATVTVSVLDNGYRGGLVLLHKTE